MKRLRRGLAAVAILASVIVATASPALSWNWFKPAFYDGTAQYFAELTNPQYNYVEIASAPRVTRTKYGFPAPVTICDWQAAMQVWVNGYWYSYDYSSYHAGCWYWWRWADFHGWTGAWLPLSNQSYTHGWWMDSDTGGWQLVGNGFVTF